jgi:VWFA-related protein
MMLAREERMAASGRALAPAFLTIALAASAYGRQVPVAETPVFGTEVKVVAVPVFVTDKAGRAVGGLTAADFELEDQGKRVPLVAFLEIDAAAETPPGAEAGPLVQASARRQFLFLFDLTFSTPTGIMRARDAALEIVRESLLPSDLAAVATYSQRGVQILVTFTPDRFQLERAIATLGLVETQAPARDTLSIAYDLGVQAWGPGIGPPPGDDMSQHLIEMSRLMARGDQAYYKQRVDGFLDGLEQLVRTLDAVQGRKQVILLSAGFDSSVIAGARGQESNEASEAVVSGRVWEVQSDRYFGDSRARDALESVFKSVAATDTVLHTVDVTGMSARGGVAEALPQPIGRGRDTLAQFAANTGGRFVADANDLQAGLESLLDASRRYYVVAFEPLDPKSKPDRLRRLKIRVRGDGLQVSHRRGYVIADPKREATPATAALQAAEAIAKGISGGELALKAVSVPYRNGSGGVSLPVILEVDGRRLSELKAKQLALEVFGYAFDAGGRILDLMTLAPLVDLAKVRPALEAKGLQVITSFAVPEGSVDLRFLVREKTSKLSGSLRLQVEVPGFDGDAVVLSPALAMDDPRARLVVPAPSRRKPQLEIPFRVGETAFTAEPLPTLANGARREVCVMAWVGNGGGSAGELDARLVDASGAERPLPLAAPPRAVADADGTTRYVLTLAPKDVPKGRYRLRIAFAGSDSAAAPRSELAVEVE